MKFGTILADPPWPYHGQGPRATLEHRPNRDSHALASIGASAVKRYGCLSIGDLCSLPVNDRIGDDAHLYLWTTNAFMEEAYQIARAWRFTPKTIITWVKMQHDDRSRVSMKTGHYFRGATEHILFGVRGSLPLQTADALPTAVLWPRAAHSVKPMSFYDMVEKASPGPYLEVFARPWWGLLGPRDGWTHLGNEVDGKDIRQALLDLA